MIAVRCAYCGALAEQPDHLTGRPKGGRPRFDEELWVPSCRSCNLVNEHAWSASGLLVVRRPPREVRVERFLFGVARLHDVGWPGPLHPGFWGALHGFVVAVTNWSAR
ncbi:MAG: hypothetical protein M0Z46_12560 [Actinomycetota bacterium]|nr:hypothetical protein [Actinomycetota bacterium]